jgi:hypothetical protein
MNQRVSRHLGSLPLCVFALLFLVTLPVWSAPQPASAHSNSPRSAQDSSAKQSTARVNNPPDISGFWERRDESGSGSFGGVSELVPAAQITDQVKKLNEETKARQQAGYVVSFASRYCQYLGMPFLMGQSPPIDIVQGKDEILIMSEQASAPRHVYLDGRGHPAPATYEPTTNGHSIGHWEGDTLVVDTIGFNELGARNVPGGGLRSKASHLVERFRLFENGKRLSITFTWTDPNVYLKPHTYEIRYFKDPPETYAFEDFCDAGDPAQGQSVKPAVVPTPQP